MTEWPTQVVIRDGIRLNYTCTGNGDRPLLVLCHGLADNGLCWQRTAQELTADFDVLMLDARNHGLSGDGPASVNDTAADISHVISSLGAESACIMGHSVGAATVAAFAGEFPQQVSKIILADPPWREPEQSPDPEKAARQHAGFARYIETLQDKSVDDLVLFGQRQYPSWHADDLPAWAASKKQVRKEAAERLHVGRWQDLVAAIGCPTLLLHGDQDNDCDGIVTARLAEKVAAMNAQVTPRRIAGAGHNLQREQFSLFIGAVRSFLG